jgi:5'-3' exoribonuclease 1
MGIPAYYKTLITKIPHAILRRTPNAVSALAVDMNCMIYHILREPQMVKHVYPGEDGRIAWERKLHDEVCKYLEHVWRCAGSPGHVYVALDGVVPFAKIKQQRFRRFKSAAERASSGSADPVWDTNAITPGTDFMRNMGAALKEIGSKHNWLISDTEEPGEGEHKVLDWLRNNKLPEGAVVVYGLDADLILLSILAGHHLGENYPIYLMREALAFGQLVRSDETGQAELCFFQIASLLKALQKGQAWSQEQLYDYIFAMSFCGNDFLPTGLSLRMRDKGHAIMLDCLVDLWKADQHLVSFEGNRAVPNAEGLKAFVNWMVREEERLIVTTIRNKFSAPHGENEEDNRVLSERAEKPLIQETESGYRLQRSWEDAYNRLALGDSDPAHRKQCVGEFWKGWCWILSYYQGLPVDREWVYAQGYPPTWRDLARWFQLPSEVPPPRETLLPQQQLALVLPLSSWSLCMKTPYRDLPGRLPQFWPQGFSVESFGKRLGWECEPRIPMLTPERLRQEMR